MNVVWFPIFSIADLWDFLKAHTSYMKSCHRDLDSKSSIVRSLNLHEKDSWRMWSLPSTRTMIPFHTLDEWVGLQVLTKTCWMVFSQTIVFVLALGMTGIWWTGRSQPSNFTTLQRKPWMMLWDSCRRTPQHVATFWPNPGLGFRVFTLLDCKRNMLLS